MRIAILLSLLALLLPLTGGPASADTPGGAAAGTFILRLPGVAADTSSGETFDPGATANGVRYCRYLPGVSVPAVLPPEASRPAPAAFVPPASTAVPASTTAAQLGILEALSGFITDQYVDPNFNGHNWQEIRSRYAAMIAGGTSSADFAKLIDAALNELGDGHSYYQTAVEVADEEAINQSTLTFVGTGIIARPLFPDGPATVIAVYPGGGAAEAGVLPHDLILDINGLPPFSATGVSNGLGPAGSVAILRIQRPGGATFTKSVVRRAINANVPIDSCMIPGTRIGYILIPTLLDLTVDDQVRAALQKMAAAGPLTGLIIDNRVNGGGFGSMATAVLGFFTSGNQGAQLTRTSTIPFTITPENIGGSQSLPLVVLVGPGTASYGEVTSGTLQRSGRAKVIGTTTYGNVELLTSKTFADGSRAWIATRTFQPVGLAAGIWEDTGIVPDISVNSPWHLFTEANDPALAAALQVLSP